MRSRAVVLVLGLLSLLLLAGLPLSSRADGTRFDRLSRTELVRHVAMLEKQLAAFQSRSGVFGSGEWYERLGRQRGDLEVSLSRLPNYSHQYPIGFRYLERVGLLEAWLEIDLGDGVQLVFLSHWSGRHPAGRPRAVTLVLRALSPEWRFWGAQRMDFLINGKHRVAEIGHVGLRYRNHVVETLWRGFDAASLTNWSLAESIRVAIGESWVDVPPAALRGLHDLATLGQSR